MSRGFITQRRVAELKPGETLWDADGKGAVPGFGARRQTETGSVSYVVKYRHGGKPIWVTLGRESGGVTPEIARGKARAIMLAVGGGADPAAAKRAEKAEPTLGEFFDREYSEWSAAHKKPRSIDGDVWLFKKHIRPALGALKMTAISDVDAGRLHRKLRMKPYTANRVRSLVSHMYTIARSPEYRVIPKGTQSPYSDVTPYEERKRTCLLTAEELSRLGAALERAERGWTEAEIAALPPAERPERASPEDWRSVAIIRLLIVSGARRGEMADLEWEWVDWERGIARLPDSKTDEKSLQLSAPALQILADLPRFKNQPRVFPGDRHGQPYVGHVQAWQRIRALAKLEHVRIHDLRHVFGGTAASAEESIYILSKTMGHSNVTTTQRYADMHMSPIRALADRNAARLEAAMRGTSAEIIDMKGGRK